MASAIAPPSSAPPPPAEVEKADAIMAQVSDDPEEAASKHVEHTPDWTEEEERKAVWRLDIPMMTVLIIALFNVQMDHSNISATLTSSILEDLSINTNDINTGAQLFLLGIILFELPSNILMQKFSPHKWLSIQIVCWGLVATFQAFIQNYSQFLATRFILGLFEAGFVPGGIFILTMFYKREEFSTRVAIYYLGKSFSNAVASLIAAGILHLEGHLGWGGWRWIFMIEGCATLAAAIIFCFFLPIHPDRVRPMIGLNRWSYVTPRQQEIITTRLKIEHAKHGGAREKPTVKGVLATFKNYKLILHIGVTMMSAAALHGLTSYTPLMIKSFGFSRVHSNALASVGYFGNMIVTVLLSWFGERTNQRGIAILMACSWSVIAWSCLTLVADLESKWSRYAILAISAVCGTTVHILNVGWLLYNTNTSTSRGIYSALMVISANLGGLSGGQIFREDDRPLYRRGIRTMVGIIAGCWGLIAVLNFIYVFEKRRAKKEKREE